jgi:hypothetical protein
MQIPVRWMLFIATSLLLTTYSPAAPKPSEDDIEHIREELGVNGFTAPSIELVLHELDTLKPFPFDKVWRDLPESTPQDRPRLALATGAVIADGFLAVASEKQSRIEPVGRALLRLAKGLGVADHVTKHSRSILEKAARSQWSAVKQELVRTQAEVESALMGLKDEEVAHLIALGGWLRALEITSTAVEDDYSVEKARTLIQPELLDYFVDRVSTLNPTFKKTKLAQTIEKNLTEVKTITTKPVDTPITKDEVKHIRDLARTINQQVSSNEG